MADSSDNTFAGNLIGLGVSLAIPFLWELLGIPLLPLSAFLGATVGAIFLARMNVLHRSALDDGPGANDPDSWLQEQLRLARGGVTVVIGASAFLWLASRWNSRLLAAVAIVAIFVGLIPVLRLVRFDASKADNVEVPTQGNQNLTALRLNIGFVAAAVFPACIILGGWRSGSIIAGAGILLWLLGAYAWRFEGIAWGLMAIGVLLIGGAALIFWLADITSAGDLRLPGGLLVAGLVLMTASGRGLTDTFPTPLNAVLALGLFVVGGAWVKDVVGGDNVSTMLVLVAIGVPFVFGITLITKGEGLMVAAAVGMFVVWAMADHTERTQPLADSDADVVIVAFGDSYMAGEGVGTFYEDANTAWDREFGPGEVSGCRRSPDAYPELLRAAVAEGSNLAVSMDFRACSGAKSISTDAWEDSGELESGEVLGDQFDAWEKEQNSLLGQFRRFDDASYEGAPAADDVDLVLLSLGGNDGGFSTIGTACFMPGSCRSAVNAIREQDLETVSSRVEVGLREADQRFPDTPILVVAYPQMFGNETTQCGLPLAGDEIEALRTFVVGLNRAVAAAIANLGADAANIRHVTETQAAFINERFCELDSAGDRSPHDAMNVLALEPTEGKTVLDRLKPTVIIHNTFHPTARGQELLAEATLPAVRNALDLPGAGTAPLSCDNTAEGCIDTEVSTVAPPDADNPCTDIDHYVACVAIRLIRQLLPPMAFLVIAGRSLAVIGKDRTWFTRVVTWGTTFAPTGALRWAFRLFPVEGAQPPTTD